MKALSWWLETLTVSPSQRLQPTLEKMTRLTRLIQKTALLTLLLGSTTLVNAQSVWDDDKPAAKDSIRKGGLYVGLGVQSWMGSGSLGAFDLSSWQTTNGTRELNNANLEARLRVAETNFSGSAFMPSVTLGYNYDLSDKLTLLGELNVGSGNLSYSGAFYGGLAYELYKSENLKLTAVGKLGYGQQVLKHSQLARFQDSVTITAGRPGYPGKYVNDYGQVVFTRQGTVLDQDYVLLSLTGIQYQVGASLDYQFGSKSRFGLKWQLAYQGAAVSLDKIVVTGNQGARTDNFRMIAREVIEYKPTDAPVVKTDLTNTQANLKLNTLLHGFTSSIALQVRF